MDVLTILLFIIVCALIFTYMYYFIKSFTKNNKAAKQWPPAGYPLQCPDYWMRRGNSCVNTFGLASKQQGQILPNINLSDGPMTTAAKCGISQKSGPQWFGTKTDTCKKTGGDCYC